MIVFAIYILALLCAATCTLADDVQYAVVAFPQGQQTVGVSVGGQVHPLDRSQDTPNLFTGKAPSGDNYQYVMIDNGQNKPEASQRTLKQGATSTGNEFFGRSKTIYDVPDLPQAFNPIYPVLFTGMNRSNEIATVILKVSNTTGLDTMLKNPKGDIKDIQVDQFTYIASNEIHSYSGVGFSTSGQSTKDFAKQSYKLELNKFGNKTEKDLIYGRTVVKLRAEETDMTMAREKLVMDCIGAAGGATLSGSWVRLFINDQPFGLYVMIDDASTHFIDNVLHAGDWKYQFTGPTYKGNAMSPEQEGNLAYLGDDPTLYPEDLYKLEDKGEDKTLAKNNSMGPLIGFMRNLAALNPQQSTDDDYKKLLDPQHTLIHMAFSFLTASWDGFWYQASNYYINEDLQSKQWALITYDFDETLGNNAPDETLMTVSYEQYGRPNATRPLVDKLLQAPRYKEQFETTLKTIIKRFFKPSVIGPRLDAWTQMLKEDMEWDRSIQPHSPGQASNWTVADMVSGMNTTTKGQIGILDFVTKRSQSVCQQLQFQDNDDVAPLPAYTQGRYMDAQGQVSDHPTGGNGGNVVSPGGTSAASILSLPSSYFMSSAWCLAGLFYYLL
ncbi:coth protein-domain-containing protein [Phascolomyces articulosus]|uniref:Coth protein-domain-containing protein n=1 Tax=Phascolomyces articulosus TaxID=60185 RepID=A0AAD5PE22_9FUNG|nr:coth protein-domain-containing protein [Phascolomyces articulosus]